MWHKLIIAGRLGKDPEMRYLPSGQAVVNLSVASSRIYTDGQGERQEETLWTRVSVWGSKAEAVNQYLRKGSKVLVEGILRPDENGSPRIWTRQDGTSGASYEMTAHNVVFLDSKSEAEAHQQMVPAPGVNDYPDDDIPF